MRRKKTRYSIPYPFDFMLLFYFQAYFILSYLISILFGRFQSEHLCQKTNIKELEKTKIKLR